MSGNAAELYKLINADPGKKQDLFRQALQNPKGAMESICALGNQMNYLQSFSFKRCQLI